MSCHAQTVIIIWRHFWCEFELLAVSVCGFLKRSVEIKRECMSLCGIETKSNWSQVQPSGLKACPTKNNSDTNTNINANMIFWQDPVGGEPFWFKSGLKFKCAGSPQICRELTGEIESIQGPG